MWNRQNGAWARVVLGHAAPEERWALHPTSRRGREKLRPSAKKRKWGTEGGAPRAAMGAGFGPSGAGTRVTGVLEADEVRGAAFKSELLQTESLVTREGGRPSQSVSPQSQNSPGLLAQMEKCDRGTPGEEG